MCVYMHGWRGEGGGVHRWGRGSTYIVSIYSKNKNIQEDSMTARMQDHVYTHTFAVSFRPPRWPSG